MVVLTKFSFEPLHSLPWFPVINPISLYTMTSISSLWDLSLPPRKVTATEGDGTVRWPGSSCTSSSRSAGSTPTGLPWRLRWQVTGQVAFPDQSRVPDHLQKGLFFSPGHLPSVLSSSWCQQQGEQAAQAPTVFLKGDDFGTQSETFLH